MGDWRLTGCAPDSEGEDVDLKLPAVSSQQAVAWRSLIPAAQNEEDSEEDELSRPGLRPSNLITYAKKGPDQKPRQEISNDALLSTPPQPAAEHDRTATRSPDTCAKDRARRHARLWRGKLTGESQGQNGIQKVDLPQAIIENNSTASSPLSSLSSSWLGEPMSDHDEPMTFQLPGLKEAPGQPAPRESSQSNLAVSVVGRHFRQRTFAQLHPYAVDEAQYKQMMHARGIQAIRIQRERLEEASSEPEDQSFRIQDDMAEVSQLEAVQQSSPAASSELDRHQLSMSAQSRGIIRSPQSSSSVSRPPAKRRRLSMKRASRNPIPTKPRPLNSSTVNSNVNFATPAASDDTASPSNPIVLIPRMDHSGLTRSELDQARLSNTTPHQLRTPAKSVFSLDSSPVSTEALRLSDPPQISALSDSDSDSSSQSDSSHSSGSDGEREAAILKQRIRGVLPASWTTLDLKQVNKPRPSAGQLEQKWAGHRKHDGHVRGVARPIATHRNPPKPRSVADFDFISGDSPNSSPPAESGRDRLNPGDNSAEPRLDQDGQDWPDVDDMEDDAIDTMFSGARSSRKRGQSPIGLSRQPDKRLRQSRISAHFRGGKSWARPQRKQGARLGVLNSKSLQSGKPPSFLRLAARTARMRSDQGLASPSGKAFRMHNASEHREIQNVLHEWGHLSKSGKPAITSGALAEISGNETRHQIKSRDPSRKRTQSQAQKGMPGTSTRKTQFRLRERNASEMLDALEYTAAKRDIAKRMQRKPQASIAIQNLPGTRAAPPFNRREGYDAPQAQLSLPVLDDQHGQSLYFAELPASSMSGGHTPAPSRDLNNRPVGENPSQQRPEGASKQRSEGASKLRPARGRKKRPPRQLRLPNAVPVPLPFENNPLSRWEGGAGIERIHNEDRGHTIGLDIEQLFSNNLHAHPLPSGALLGSQTFVGSGRFSKCLSFDRKSTLDRPSLPGRTNHLGWAAWNDTVRAGLSASVSALFDVIREAQTCLHDRKETQASECIQSVEKISEFFSDDLFFLDPIDRSGFVRHCIGILESLLEALPGVSENGLASGLQLSQTRFRIQLGSRLALIAHQVWQTSAADLVPNEIRLMARQCLRASVAEVFSAFRQRGLASFELFADQYKGTFLSHETALGGTLTEVEAFLIVKEIVHVDSSCLGTVWDLLGFDVPTNESELQLPLNEIGQRLEDTWRNVFRILPLLDLDAHGNGDHGLRARRDNGNWKLVKRLLMPIFGTHAQRDVSLSAAVSAYRRLLVCRCFELLTTWNWTNYSSTIALLFDFFAMNNLANLPHEKSPRSPGFLQHLGTTAILTIEQCDGAFQVFLKLVGTGLRQMRNCMFEKKARDLMYRLIPNHDRQHPIDQELRQTDLDATRNHHNLLCTLYWGVSATQKQIIRRVRDLVQDAGSHCLAYKVNIQAWLDLVSYQIVCDSTRDALAPFTAWFSDLLERLLRQHALARTEVERQARTSEEQEGIIVGHVIKEKTIAKNQRQVESTLLHLLGALKSAIVTCPSPESASNLLVPGLSQVLALFNPMQQRLNVLIDECLNCITECLGRARPQSKEAKEPEEDSQGYDWSGLEDADNTGDDDPQAIIDESLHAALYSLLSSCLHADIAPADDLLHHVVQSWAQVSAFHVRHGLKSWDNYVGSYGRSSWSVFRDTAQKRRFAPLWIACLLEGDGKFFANQTMYALEGWVESIVDREAELKYQGHLTSQILNGGVEEDLLFNLPFSANREGKFDISLDAFRQRRLSLITALLSNIRSLAHQSKQTGYTATQERPVEYRRILQRLTESMKLRYEELGQDETAQGAYVGFVHTVLQTYQEHVQEIHPMDPFFTNPATFPPLLKDPRFITSKIKAYGLKLPDPRASKQLALFLVTTIEVAFQDGVQEHLVCQLSKAICQARPTLQPWFLQKFLPACVRTAYSDQRGWLVSRPVLMAAAIVIQDMRSDLSLCNQDDRANFMADLSLTVQCIRDGLRRSTYSRFSSSTHELSVLAVMVKLVTAMLPLLDYVLQLGHVADSLYELVSETASIRFEGSLDIDQLAEARTRNWVSEQETFSMASESEQKFIEQELQSCLGRIRRDGPRYYTLRGGAWKELSLPLDSGEPRESLNDALRQFRGVAGCLYSFEQIIEDSELLSLGLCSLRDDEMIYD